MNNHVMVNSAWNGSPVVLSLYQGVTMAVTPNGSMVLACLNRATQNNMGRLAVTSGGSQPRYLDVPALSLNAAILTHNWQANNLSIANVSVDSDAPTPILIQAYGPAIPGVTPRQLHIGKPLELASSEAAVGTSHPDAMQLIMTAHSAMFETLAIIGGPQDANGNNAYVIALNAFSGNTGPGTDTPAPPGYHATTTANSYSLKFNWGSSRVYVANLSMSTAGPVEVTMVSLV